MSKEGWATVTLGDIAENISLRVDDPSKSGLDRFVGLVHLDSGSVTVSRWDSAESVTSSMKQFQAGDVLLARRNAHLRRASAVDFEGVCSGDAYVLREKPDAIVPGLLKYILNTNRFWEYAIANADGSMSTRVKWKHAMEFKINLQDFDEQQKVVQILDGIVEYERRGKEVISICDKTFSSSLRRMCTVLLSSHECKPLEEIATVGRGKFSHRPRNLPEFYGGGIPFVQTGDIQNADRYIQSYNYTLTDAGIVHSKQFQPGTIFMTIAANIGSTAISNQPVYATDSVVGIRPDDTIQIEFLELILQNYKWHLEFEVATQTAQKNINLQNIRPLLIPQCSKEEQQKFSDFFLTLWKSSRKMSSNLKRLNELMMSVLNEKLGGEVNVL